MLKKSGDIFRDDVQEMIDLTVVNAIKKEIRDFAQYLSDKYKEKLNDLRKIRGGREVYGYIEARKEVIEYLRTDKELRDAYDVLKRRKLMSKSIVKKAFKEIFDEVLDEISIIDNGIPKTKKSLIAEKIVNGILHDTLDPVTLKGVEFIRNTIGEKPADEIISKGLQQKVIDINITEEKVNKVKSILEGLRNARLINGLNESEPAGRSDERPGNEGAVEANVSGESEGVHNANLLPDKQD